MVSIPDDVRRHHDLCARLDMIEIFFQLSRELLRNRFFQPLLYHRCFNVFGYQCAADAEEGTDTGSDKDFHPLWHTASGLLNGDKTWGGAS